MWAIKSNIQPYSISSKGTNVKCNETFKLLDELQPDDVTNLMSFHIFSYRNFLEKKVKYICNVVFILKYLFAR